MRNSNQILDRAFALLITADRGLLERPTHSGGTHTLREREEKRKLFCGVVEERGLRSSLTAYETRVLQAGIETLGTAEFEQSQWAYEAIPALLWSLSLRQKPVFVPSPCEEDFHPVLGKHRKPGSSPLQVNARSVGEMEAARMEALLWHWRAREGIDSPSFPYAGLHQRLSGIFGRRAEQVLDQSSWFDGSDFRVSGRRFADLSEQDGGRLFLKAMYLHKAYHWCLSDQPWDEIVCDT